METRKRRWPWVLLFIFLAATIAVLATSWNVVLLQDYRKMVELGRSVQLPQEIHAPSWGIAIGTLGFVAILVLGILLFVRLLTEMRINQMQSEFLAAVTHELKTPITALSLALPLLRQDSTDPADRERLWDSAARELARLSDEVNRILETARWQGGPFKTSPREVSLEKWLTESMPRWRDLLGSEAQLTRDGAALPDRAWVDPRALDLIFDNLIDNSRKFARDNPKVEIHTRRAPDGWTIEVADQGWGFDSQQSKKIFRRFFRANHSAPYAIPGTGLGLHLAKGASRSLGLTIQGESPGVGKGAKFTVTSKQSLEDITP